jgi:tetratricopeptide (TPR) repeat protein
MPLGQLDLRHLSAAHGYMELDMFEAANAELEEIDPLCRHLPEVLDSRVVIYQGLQKWELMAIVARKLVEWNPGEAAYFLHLAYASRRAASLHVAHAILIHAAELHPGDGLIQFNLACYESQIGHLDQAKAHLKRATKIDPKFKLMALEDPDLEPLWTSSQPIRRETPRCSSVPARQAAFPLQSRFLIRARSAATSVSRCRAFRNRKAGDRSKGQRPEPSLDNPQRRRQGAPLLPERRLTRYKPRQGKRSQHPIHRRPPIKHSDAQKEVGVWVFNLRLRKCAARAKPVYLSNIGTRVAALGSHMSALKLILDRAEEDL